MVQIVITEQFNYVNKNIFNSFNRKHKGLILKECWAVHE